MIFIIPEKEDFHNCGSLSFPSPVSRRILRKKKRTKQDRVCRDRYAFFDQKDFHFVPRGNVGFS